jgi:hypothetical protein
MSVFGRVLVLPFVVGVGVQFGFKFVHVINGYNSKRQIVL